MGVGVPLLLAAILVPLLRRHRRRISGVRGAPPDLLPSPAVEVDPRTLEVKPFTLHHPPGPSHEESALFLAAHANSSNAAMTSHPSSPDNHPTQPTVGAQPSSNGPSPLVRTSATSPDAPVSGKRKLRLMNDYPRPASSSTASLAQSSHKVSGQTQRRQSSSTGPANHAEEVSRSSEVLIQHRDGGTAVLRELPPPYMDLSRPSSSASQHVSLTE